MVSTRDICVVIATSETNQKLASHLVKKIRHNQMINLTNDLFKKKGYAMNPNKMIIMNNVVCFWTHYIVIHNAANALQKRSANLRGPKQITWYLATKNLWLSNDDGSDDPIKQGCPSLIPWCFSIFGRLVQEPMWGKKNMLGTMWGPPVIRCYKLVYKPH